MHVISRKALVDFWDKHRDSERQLAAWFKVADAAKWEKWADVQNAFPKASLYERCLIFNVCGNSYRLITRRSANWKTLFVVGVYTHRDYDKNAWKDYCLCR